VGVLLIKTIQLKLTVTRSQLSPLINQSLEKIDTRDKMHGEVASPNWYIGLIRDEVEQKV